MLKLLKTPNSHKEAAGRIYARLLSEVRRPFFYEILDVPDTMTGRFDLLLAYLFFIIRRTLAQKDFNQALFDALFADMDQTLREQGVGDMGVPKHMKRMMKAFNGRMQAYRAALGDETAFKEALRRNVYGSRPDVSEDSLKKMADFMEKIDRALQDQDPDDLMRGEIHLPGGDSPDA